jgi:TolB-like protein
MHINKQVDVMPQKEPQASAGSGGKDSANASRTQAALANIFRSRAFRRARRLQRLLEYVLEPEARLSERAIAAEVFDRDDFDPHTDTLVRVQFGRLRRRLDQYYKTEGQDDPLRIVLPARGYHPSVEPSDIVIPELGVNAQKAVRNLRRPPSTGPAPSDPGNQCITSGEHHLIAVIPFANLTGDSQHDVFSQGLTEELIKVLAGVSDVKVVSRTSAFQFKDESVDIRIVGSELGVDLILEGSVRREDARTRVIAELTSVTDGFVIWSDAFDYDGESILDGQAAIAQAIQQALSSKLPAAA